MRLPSGPLPLIALWALAGTAGAQVTPIDYSHNWAPMHRAPNVAFSGPGLFGFFTGEQTYATPSEAIRRCYGFDTTQGGRNQSAGVWESAWFKVAQGYASTNAVPGVDIGRVSVGSATDSDPQGDPGFAPLFASVGNTGGWQVAAEMTPGLIASTAGFPFPWTWEVVFQWSGPGVGPYGITGPSTLGTDLGGGGPGNPLLTSVIFEIQGPPTGGPLNDQYFLASTTETVGANVTGPGGFANGNPDFGKSLFVSGPTLTNAISHTRFLVDHPLVGPTGVTNIYVNTPGDTEFVGHMAFNTPFLWAIKDGNDGAGAADWRVGTAPVSTVDLRLLDQLSGGQTNANLDYKFGGSGAPAAAFDPAIVFNQALFLWSHSHAQGMFQEPTSWDDLGGTVFPAQPGSLALGSFMTSREGPQRLPIVFDSLSAALLNFPGITLGKPFTGSDDPNLDGLIVDGLGDSHSSMWEGMFDPVISGVSTFSGGPLRVLANPKPSMAGTKLGVAAVGLQIRVGPGGSVLELTEVASSLELDLQ